MKMRNLTLVSCIGVFLGASFGEQSSRPELLDPPICSTLHPSAKSAPLCKVVKRQDGSGVSDIDLSLTAANSPVHVAGYLVASDAYNGTFIPPLVETSPGSSINIDLHDELPGDPTDAMVGHTNLHTHGLLVSPQNEINDGGPGDNILVDLQKGMAFNYRIPIPTALQAGILDNPKPIKHPDGLYWYHPHFHMQAKRQVSGGMSGVISIGRAKELLVVNRSNGQRDNSATTKLKQITDVKYLELKDIQIKTSVEPEQAAGSAPANWNVDSDPAFCGAVNIALDGYCEQKPTGNTATGLNQVWLFTINGQRYPRIDIKAGRNHLWRIANLSATVTYLLELNDQANPISFEIVSVDGVVAGGSAENGSVAAVKSNRLLLMPAGRAEVLVRNDGSNPGPDRNLVLRTVGLNTGPDGDSWPVVNLAEIHLEKTQKTAPVSVRSLVPEVSSDAALTAHPNALAAPNVHIPKGCTRSVLNAGEWRRITLDENTSTNEFFIGSETANAHGASSDTIPPKPFPVHGVDWENDPHVCVSLGESEIWEIDNKTRELHNFHLHQAKFRLARPDELSKLGLPGVAVIDPTNILNGGLKVDLASESLNAATVWHDTLPVPLADDSGKLGTIFIVINFKATEQIGRYVFHCHILEHEDNGMMAPIEVLRGKTP